MSADLIQHPSAPQFLCERCAGSPIERATHTVGVEITPAEGYEQTKPIRIEQHVCSHCLERVFGGKTRFLVSARAVVVRLPLRRLQKKRR